MNGKNGRAANSSSNPRSQEYHGDPRIDREPNRKESRPEHATAASTTDQFMNP